MYLISLTLSPISSWCVGHLFCFLLFVDCATYMCSYLPAFRHAFLRPSQYQLSTFLRVNISSYLSLCMCIPQLFMCTSRAQAYSFRVYVPSILMFLSLIISSFIYPSIYFFLHVYVPLSACLLRVYIPPCVCPCVLVPLFDCSFICITPPHIYPSMCISCISFQVYYPSYVFTSVCMSHSCSVYICPLYVNALRVYAPLYDCY